MSNRTERWVEQNCKRRGRRWFLTAAGVAIALPYLEVFQEKAAQAAAGSKRLFLFHMPAGVNVTTWAPQGTGTNFSFGPAMKPIDDAGLKSKVAVVTGTNAVGGPRGHTCGISGVLTGVGCGTNTSNAISFDQSVAQSFAGQTRFPSIELGTSHNTENPNAEAGYSTVLKDNLNWSSPTTPLSREIEPLKAFNRLFAGLPASGGGQQPQAMSMKDAMRKSMLDYTLAEGNALSARLGSADKMKLEQYLDGLRALEKSIQITPTVGQTGVCTPGAIPSAGRPSDIQVHVKLMLDIAITAFKCDLTRVITFAYEHTTTEIRHPFLGVNVGFHTSVTHHAGAAGALANYTTVNQWLVSQYAYVLKALDQVADGTGTMLDSSACMCFSELSDGNSHSNQNMPVLLGGSAGGKLQTGRVISGSGVIEQVHVGLLQALGVNASTFGRAKGPLPGLLA